MSEQPAFPGQISAGYDVREGKEWHEGLTKREYMAIQVGAAVMASATGIGNLGDEELNALLSRWAALSYKMADAMLAGCEVRSC